MDDLYREIILDHYKNPRNNGTLDKPTHSHEAINPMCGDKINVELRIDDNTIGDVKFTGEGCAISMASISMLTDDVMGKQTGYLKQLGKDDIVSMLGAQLTPARLKCALLGLEALQKAIQK